ERRQLLCARDVLGLKPFYYHQSRDLFLFASEPQALLTNPSVTRRVNEGMVGEYLSVATSVDETLLADVHRLPRAHRLILTAGGARRDRYWEIDPAKQIRYRTVDEYCEHLRALLRVVVRGRLRSSTGVGVMLSGGVDSSTLLTIATELIRGGEIDVACSAFSLVDPGGPLDDTEFIVRVVATVGGPSDRILGAMS